MGNHDFPQCHSVDKRSSPFPLSITSGEGVNMGMCDVQYLLRE